MKRQSEASRHRESVGMEKAMHKKSGAYHQTAADRRHESEGMKRAMNHSSSSPNYGYGSHEDGSSSHLYRNEVEKPELPMEGHPIPPRIMGMGPWLAQADPIAYGACEGQCIAMDQDRMDSQFKDYHWD